MTSPITDQSDRYISSTFLYFNVAHPHKHIHNRCKDKPPSMAGNKAAPGGKLLGLDDLGAVLNELFSCRDKWYNLGLQLLVSVSDLQKIESEYKNDHGTCLRQMLTKWLESGRGNWETLCQAIDSPIVRGDDNSLVAKLRGKFCQGEEKKTKKRKASETLATPGIPTKVLQSVILLVGEVLNDPPNPIPLEMSRIVIHSLCIGTKIK